MFFVKLKCFFYKTNQSTITIGNDTINMTMTMTMTSAAMQVYSMPELMKLVYEYDATYHVHYERCLAELPQALEDRKSLCMGRKLLDMYMTKDMEELGYKLVKVVSCETDELTTSRLELEMWLDDDDLVDDTSTDTSVLSALRLETSWYANCVTVTCKYRLPDSDVVKLYEAYLENVRYRLRDESLKSGYHNLREKPGYSEDMDE